MRKSNGVPSSSFPRSGVFRASRKTVPVDTVRERLPKPLDIGSRHRSLRYSAAEAVSAAAGGPRLQVLVADDNVVNQELVRRILEKENCTVAVVSTGIEAILALLDRRFDLVIMDIQMPEMDGLEATAAIRSGMVLGIDAAVPVIAVSATSFPEDRMRCLQAGASDFVAKPFTSTQLLSAVRKFRRLPRKNVPAAPVNKQEVLERLGDQELLDLVCSAFVRDAPVLVAHLDAAIRAGDLTEAERHAHSLKGAAANVGAEELRLAAYAMENAVEQGKLKGLPSLHIKIRRLVEAAVKALQETP